MSTLYIKRERYSTVYYYGSMMVIHYDITELDLEESFHTHQLKTQEHKEDNNRIMWERW